MKARLTIGKRIVFGFGVLIILFIVAYFISNGVVERARATNEVVNKINTPSTSVLGELKNNIIFTRESIRQWVNLQSSPEDLFKRDLIRITEVVIPELQDSINQLSQFWTPEEQQLKTTIFQQMDSLFSQHAYIRGQLVDFESYSDVSIMFEVQPMVEDKGSIDVLTKKVLENLNTLIKSREANTNDSIKLSDESFDNWKTISIWLGIIFVISGILVAYFTVKSIVTPVSQLRAILLKLGRGEFPKNQMYVSNDEIGDMAHASNLLVDGLKRTTDFSKAVGSGNFDYDYKPLSEDDTLGHALLKMRDDLAENERILEQKVIERTAEVVRQKEEIEVQNQKLEELYKDITDSIRYAKRLQESILPSQKVIDDLLPNSFVLYKPKDIVSGDFYWFETIGDKVLFAAVDCTGHGVPGAFMSIVGHNSLNQAVREHHLNTPALILDDLNKLATRTLNQNLEDSQVRDGMDLALCALDAKNMKLEYAGAYNPLYLIRDGEIIQTKADKFAIGGRRLKQEKLYTNHEIALQKGDVIYIFSDGFADQFGGEKGKKFMYRQFRELLLSISDKSMDDQKEILNKTIEDWRGSFEQVDDILVIGVRV